MLAFSECKLLQLQVLLAESAHQPSQPKTKDHVSLVQLLFGLCSFLYLLQRNKASSLISTTAQEMDVLMAMALQSSTQTCTAGRMQPTQPEHASTAVLTTKCLLWSQPTHSVPLAHFSPQPPINLQPLSKAIICVTR